jgi:hypothetical protein
VDQTFPDSAETVVVLVQSLTSKPGELVFGKDHLHMVLSTPWLV